MNEEFGDGKSTKPLRGDGGPVKRRESLVEANGIALSDGEADRQMDEEEIGHEQELNEKLVDVPPNGGYGWVCVACIATINAYVGCNFDCYKTRQS
jgi:hypothetical protein